MEKGTFIREFDRMFNPKSVAVVGASNLLGKWGFLIPVSILGGGYKGRLFMVNPNEKTVLGFPAHRSLRDIEEPVDLVVVTIPAAKVPVIIEDAAAKGVKNMVIVSSNFSEAGREGAELERHVARLANDAGITIVGPNTMGIFSASASLSAVGAAVIPPDGCVGFVSQSGNLGVQLLGWGKRRGVGFSRFIGSGNAANTDMADYVSFLGEDPLTKVIALYIEGLDDGRRFLEIARGIAPHKPIVVLKGGRGEQGGRAALSHSGAMAGQLELFEGMFEQAGLVQAEDSEEFMDLVTAFSALPRANGRKVAIMTMGGGWGVIAADACDREGLELADLPQSVIEELDRFLPRYWSRGNPVDLVGNLRRSNHYRTIDTLISCDGVDILIVMGALLGKELVIESVFQGSLWPFLGILRNHLSRLPAFIISQWKGFLDSFSRRKGQNPLGSVGINPGEAWLWTDAALAARLHEIVQKTGKPIITVAMDERELSAAARLQAKGILSAPTPERAVRAAAKIAHYSEFAAKARVC